MALKLARKGWDSGMAVCAHSVHNENTKRYENILGLHQF